MKTKLYILIRSVLVLVNISAILVTNEKTHENPFCRNIIERNNRLKWTFFTNWNFYLQQVFLVYGIIADLLVEKSPEKSSKSNLNLLRSLFFLSIIYTNCIYLMVWFWGTYYYNREIIHPKINDVCYTHDLNHLKHTFVLLPPILEIVFNKVILLDLKVVFGTTFVYGLVYLYALIDDFFVCGSWAYGLLDNIGWITKILMVLMTYLLAFLSLKLLYLIELKKHNFMRKISLFRLQ